MTAAVLTQCSSDIVPEMKYPHQTVVVNPGPGYTREVIMRSDSPYMNASVYCNRIGLRFSSWLRHPATIALIQAQKAYHREAAHEHCPIPVMQVKSGPRIVHGYYLHMMFHDALSTWCDFELLPAGERPRLPAARPRTTVVYTTQTVINANASPEMIAAAQAGARERITNVINAVRRGC